MTDTFRAQLQATLGTAYSIERELGGGGMSRVFVARDEALGREVVIKVIKADLAEGVSAERFTREVKLAARLQQANIVPVLTAGTADDVPYYTMPFVKGESLRIRISTGQPLTLAESTGILRDVTWRVRWRMRMRKASCIATSSPRTSCYRAARRWSPTSASPRP